MIKIKFVFTVNQKSYVDNCPKAVVDEKSAHAVSSQDSSESISKKVLMFLVRFGVMYVVKKLVDYFFES
ncbi:MAG: hypothetical protein REI12_01850 [Pedobacter sp.]|nr:hypothetical protein [Pedobacter sp.]